VNATRLLLPHPHRTADCTLHRELAEAMTTLSGMSEHLVGELADVRSEVCMRRTAGAFRGAACRSRSTGKVW
jgi:hypothetical protein